MESTINMYTDSKGITRTLVLGVDQVNNRSEIEITLQLSKQFGPKKDDFTHETHLNLFYKEAQILVNCLLPVVKPNCRIVSIKPRKQ